MVIWGKIGIKHFPVMLQQFPHLDN